MSAQHCSVKNGKKGKGTSHAQYVVGKGKYSDREDVLGIVTGNMPDWSPDGVTFFVAADKYERLNGRSYKEVEFAIPREVTDPVAYAAEFAHKLLGQDYPYLAGIHSKLAADGLPNTHCHLMFSERKLDGHARNSEHFFKRSDSKKPERGGCGKDREMNKREWVQSVRGLHQAHAQAHGIELDMRSNAARGLGPPEPKIGPAARRGPVDTYRDVLVTHVSELRQARKPIIPKPIAPKPAGINPESRYHPDNIARRAAEEKVAQHAANVAQEAQAALTAARHKAFEAKARQKPKTKPAENAHTPQANPEPLLTLEKTLSERLAASLEEFIQWIKELGGKKEEINTQSSLHVGRIVQANDLHAIQKTNPRLGGYVVHEQARFAAPLRESTTVIEVQYSNGQGYVTGQNVNHSLER